jgi:hypothetical protein
MRTVTTSLAAAATAAVLGLGLAQPANAAPVASTPAAATAAAMIAPHASPSTFPMTHSLGPVVVSPQYPFYESADVKINASGQLNVTQHVYDHSWFVGFNGGTMVVLSDAAGNELWRTQQTHGVDGQYVPFGTSDRYYYWTDQVPQNVLNTPGLQVQIVLYNNPQNTFWGSAAAIIRQIAGAVKG